MKKLTFFTWAFFACATMMNAQTISDADNAILDKIKNGNRNHTSITSNFDQTKHMPIFDEDMLSGGKFYYSKPDKLAMWYDEPAGDLMLINDDKFVMIAAGRRNETTSKNAKMRGMKEILSACLEGDIRKVETTTIICEETPKEYIVTAELAGGKGNKSNISKVVVNYDKKDNSLSVLRTDEPDGTYTIYALKDKKLNQPIEETVFQSTK